MAKKPYQENSQVSQLTAGIQERGYLEYRDLVKIGAWKSAIACPLLTVNEPNEIKRVTEQAIRHVRDNDIRAAIMDLSLIGMNGGLPMRSAILAVSFYPDLPVIDIWSQVALKMEKKKNTGSLDDYLQCVKEVRRELRQGKCDSNLYVAYVHELRIRLNRGDATDLKQMDELLMAAGRRLEEAMKEKAKSLGRKTDWWGGSKSG